MTLHLKKLAVGVASVADFERTLAARMRDMRARGDEPALRHLTRHLPKRRAELLDGGSLYWVVAGLIAARTRLLAIDAIADAEGKRCALVLEPRLVRTVPRPHGPFQGWRYLRGEDAPPDLEPDAGAPDMPADMMHELVELGVL